MYAFTYSYLMCSSLMVPVPVGGVGKPLLGYGGYGVGNAGNAGNWGLLVGAYGGYPLNPLVGGYGDGGYGGKPGAENIDFIKIPIIQIKPKSLWLLKKIRFGKNYWITINTWEWTRN